MNEQQAVAVRDLRDPFSQALSLLFKEAKNPSELKEKYRKEMIPLITQVAFKIGAIDTEKSISERAIPVFAGMVSLYLAGIKEGVGTVADWAGEIQSNPLAILFRKGYTTFHAVENIMVTIKLGEDEYTTPLTIVERMVLYTTHRADGVWAGYALCISQRNSLEAIQMRNDFCAWIVKTTHGEEIVREAHRDAFDAGGLEEAVIIRRALYNVLYIGKLSLHWDYYKIESLVIAARRPGWRARAKERYKAFVRGLPPQFKRVVSDRNSLIGHEILELWTHVGLIADPSRRKEWSINVVCLAVDVPPAGLKSEIKKALDDRDD